MTEEFPDLPAELGGFYDRRPGDKTPLIKGESPRYDSRCKICSLVRRLQKDQEYTFHEAVAVEEMVYRMYHNFWDHYEIADWLTKTHKYDISHDSVSRHANRHMIDPRTAFLERVRNYRPDHMQPRFFQSMAETMRMGIMQFREDLIAGRVEIKPKDFLAMIEVYREWQEQSAGDLEGNLMDAVVGALEDLDLPPEYVVEFKQNFRRRLEETKEDE